MKTKDFQLSYYETIAIVVPGGLLLFGLSLLWPDLQKTLVSKDMSVGGLGLFIVLSLAAGHLIQVVGNVLADLLWRLCGGMPSDWVRSGKRELISSGQVARTRELLKARCHVSLPDDLSQMSSSAWYGVVRQIYADVAANGKPERADSFNGTYGLIRGISAALLVLGVTVWVKEPQHWCVAIGIMAVGLLAMARVYRFGVNYAREVFIQFLQLKLDPSATNGAGGVKESEPKTGS